MHFLILPILPFHVFFLSPSLLVLLNVVSPFYILPFLSRAYLVFCFLTLSLSLAHSLSHSLTHSLSLSSYRHATIRVFIHTLSTQLFSSEGHIQEFHADQIIHITNSFMSVTSPPNSLSSCTLNSSLENNTYGKIGTLSSGKKNIMDCTVHLILFINMLWVCFFTCICVGKVLVHVKVKII